MAHSNEKKIGTISVTKKKKREWFASENSRVPPLKSFKKRLVWPSVKDFVEKIHVLVEQEFSVLVAQWNHLVSF